MTYSVGTPTYFPQGFPFGMVLKQVPILQAQPGQVFWLNNSSVLNPQQHAGSDGNHGTYLDPFASLSAALAQCVPGRGDIIMVGSGHQETISNATAYSLNVSGVAVVGLGAGPFRPTFTLSTAAAATINVTGSNITISNCLFIANFANITSVFTQAVSSFTGSISGNLLTVTAVGSGTLYYGNLMNATGLLPNTTILTQQTGATAGGVGTYLVNNNYTTPFASATITTVTQDVQIDNCEFRDSSAILNFISLFSDAGVASSLSGFNFTRCTISSLGTTAATTAIKVTANQDRVSINDNVGNWAILNNTAAMLATGANSITNFQFDRNHIYRPNTATTSGLAISTSGTAWTGTCNDNRIFGLNNSAQIWINTGTKLGFNQNFCPITAVADKSGLINPAAV